VRSSTCCRARLGGQYDDAYDRYRVFLDHVIARRLLRGVFIQSKQYGTNKFIVEQFLVDLINLGSGGRFRRIRRRSRARRSRARRSRSGRSRRKWSPRRTRRKRREPGGLSTQTGYVVAMATFGIAAGFVV